MTNDKIERPAKVPETLWAAMSAEDQRHAANAVARVADDRETVTEAGQRTIELAKDDLADQPESGRWIQAREAAEARLRVSQAEFGDVMWRVSYEYGERERANDREVARALRDKDLEAARTQHETDMAAAAHERSAMALRRQEDLNLHEVRRAEDRAEAKGRLHVTWAIAITAIVMAFLAAVLRGVA